MATYSDYIAQGLDPSAAAYRARQDMGMTSGQTAGQASAVQQVGMGGGWSPQAFLQNYTNAVDTGGNMIDHGIYGIGTPPRNTTNLHVASPGNPIPFGPVANQQAVAQEPWKIDQAQQKPMQMGGFGQQFGGGWGSQYGNPFQLGGGYGGYQGGYGSSYGGYGGGQGGGYSPYRQMSQSRRRGLLW